MKCTHQKIFKCPISYAGGFRKYVQCIWSIATFVQLTRGWTNTIIFVHLIRNEYGQGFKLETFIIHIFIHFYTFVYICIHFYSLIIYLCTFCKDPSLKIHYLLICFLLKIEICRNAEISMNNVWKCIRITIIKVSSLQPSATNIMYCIKKSSILVASGRYSSPIYRYNYS